MISKHLLRAFLLIGICMLNACESNPPAPVIDRAPNATKPPAKPASKPAAGAKDWRPETHTVKKGDTLYGIGLEYGLDYKEIAQLNQINPPYAIQIGQVLLLREKTAAATTPQAGTSGDGVVITPIQTDGSVTPSDTTPSQVTPILTAPKASKEPYSDAAFAKPLPAQKPADGKTPASTTSSQDATSDEQIEWGVPTTGKIVSRFNESGNKGIDFEGKTGQAVNAAAAGKAIYVGSDLRGYGKLVIIKHNKTYLSVYAHNSKLLVKEGQSVTAGQKIAEMGNTDADKVKLHFEIRKQGKSVDPEKYLSKN